ncbi:hypothetical protein CL622_00165 [archaeon]|nr:hypothetical protein [archaeon]|tara:strand:- start:448 stop:702 length:255 start_codon:yes stop_codon:yes gene_type:complete
MNQQINIRLPSNLMNAAKDYAKLYGYKNVQDLTMEAIREKVFENAEIDFTVSDEEIELIEALVSMSIKQGKLHSKKDIMAKLTE